MKEEERSVDYVKQEGEIVRRQTDERDLKKKKNVQMENQGKGQV